MPDDTVITFGLAGLALSCGGGGLWFAYWLAQQLKALKMEILDTVARVEKDAVARVQTAHDEVKQLERDVKAIAQTVGGLELHTERNFLSKQTATMVFERLEKGIGDIRTSIDASRNSMEARLIRIESHFQPSAMLPPVNRREG